MKSNNSIEILQKIRNIAIACPQTKRFSDLVGALTKKFQTQDIKNLAHSKQALFMTHQFQKLKFEDLQKPISILPQQKQILALSVLRQKQFSLILVIVPKGMQFNWHDHPSMLGNTKCLFGAFKIIAIDSHYFLKQSSLLLKYPKQFLRTQIIESHELGVSTIFPDTYNIHKIQALQQSCFLDLLIPDYPQNHCDFYRTINQDQKNLYLQLLDSPLEEIVDINILLTNKKSNASYSSYLESSSN